ncbi:MAG: helix-turn-helix domain-containing protein [Pseudomonadota bacterium]
MQAESANCRARAVSVIVYDNVKLLDVSGPLQVFSDARFEDGSSAYRISLISVSGLPVSTDTIMQISATHPDAAPRADTVIVAGGRGALSARYSAELQKLLHAQAHMVRRVCSVCLGAFILAEAGLLDEKRATTHWSECDRLAQEYPSITVTGDEIFVTDGAVWTSAGVTAGIDMALALVEEDLGRTEALRIARTLVLPTKRQGGQSQYSTTMRHLVDSSTGRFDALLSDIRDRPAETYTVPSMAALMHMSERNFARAFKAETGQSPAQYVESVRVEAARDALLDGRASLKSAALEFGFGSDETMRRAFKRRFGATPTALMEKFSSA